MHLLLQYLLYLHLLYCWLTVTTVWIVLRCDGSLITDCRYRAIWCLRLKLAYSKLVTIFDLERFPRRFNNSSSLLVEERRIYSHLFIIKRLLVRIHFADALRSRAIQLLLLRATIAVVSITTCFDDVALLSSLLQSQISFLVLDSIINALRFPRQRPAHLLLRDGDGTCILSTAV